MLDEENNLSEIETSETTDETNISEIQNEELDNSSESIEEIAETSTESEEETDDELKENNDKDKNYETVDWVKKRLAQKDRQLKKRLRDKEKEIEYLRTQVSAIFQPTQQEYSAPQGQILDPATGQYVDEDSVEGKVILKLQQMQQAEAVRQQTAAAQMKQKALNSKIEEVKEKYDDFEDVIKDSYNHFPSAMSEIMLNNPGSVETFYDLAKNNPQKLAEISKLSEFQQLKAINFIEFQKENKVTQKLRSDAPKPTPPVKPSTTNFVEKDSYDAIYERQREELKRRTGK